MVARVKRDTFGIATLFMTAFLGALFGRVVMRFTQRLPILAVPKQLERGSDPVRITTGVRVFQPMRDDMIHYGSRANLTGFTTHDAQRVRA